MLDLFVGQTAAVDQSAFDHEAAQRMADKDQGAIGASSKLVQLAIKKTYTNIIRAKKKKRNHLHSGWQQVPKQESPSDGGYGLAKSRP